MDRAQRDRQQGGHVGDEPERAGDAEERAGAAGGDRRAPAHGPRDITAI